ncbi:hypothetical protein [Streptomyces sp. CCM_MD2014]|uniref:hypothetical protein n=1 Tax=Streptomyces sp. CCM_MD2014 TaxID=1561022 RepID=UPI00052A932C|nr:hypothetical protein [Streptomyces sp. CCM_MD2014]AIV35554.1 hypothetical protein NI25_20290 [Streptomyces sp. CCM_MD2014]
MTTHLEPFGADYLQPVQEACAYCLCCSAALCRRGRASVLECVGSTHADRKSTVTGCPCSASTTEGTASWRAGLVTATLQAVELPLPEPMEDVLRALAAGETTVPDPFGFLLALRIRQFVQTRDDVCAVTDLGRAYLAARDGQRLAVRARVLDVDAEENAARVVLDVCRPDQRVTVLLDQLVHATGVDPLELPGLELDVVANVDAERQEEIVLTRIQARPAPLPETWRKTPAVEAAPDGEEAPGD